MSYDRTPAPPARSDPAALLVTGLLVLTVAALATSLVALLVGTVLCVAGLVRSARDDVDGRRACAPPARADGWVADRHRGGTRSR